MYLINELLKMLDLYKDPNYIDKTTLARKIVELYFDLKNLTTENLSEVEEIISNDTLLKSLLDEELAKPIEETLNKQIFEFEKSLVADPFVYIDLLSINSIIDFANNLTVEPYYYITHDIFSDNRFNYKINTFTDKQEMINSLYNYLLEVFNKYKSINQDKLEQYENLTTILYDKLNEFSYDFNKSLNETEQSYEGVLALQSMLDSFREEMISNGVYSILRLKTKFDLDMNYYQTKIDELKNTDWFKKVGNENNFVISLDVLNKELTSSELNPANVKNYLQIVLELMEVLQKSVEIKYLDNGIQTKIFKFYQKYELESFVKEYTYNRLKVVESDQDYLQVVESVNDEVKNIIDKLDEVRASYQNLLTIDLTIFNPIDLNEFLNTLTKQYTELKSVYLLVQDILTKYKLGILIPPLEQQFNDDTDKFENMKEIINGLIENFSVNRSELEQVSEMLDKLNKMIAIKKAVDEFELNSIFELQSPYHKNMDQALINIDSEIKNDYYNGDFQKIIEQEETLNYLYFFYSALYNIVNIASVFLDYKSSSVMNYYYNDWILKRNETKEYLTEYYNKLIEDDPTIAGYYLDRLKLKLSLLDLMHNNNLYYIVYYRENELYEKVPESDLKSELKEITDRDLNMFLMQNKLFNQMKTALKYGEATYIDININDLQTYFSEKLNYIKTKEQEVNELIEEVTKQDLIKQLEDLTQQKVNEIRKFIDSNTIPEIIIDEITDEDIVIKNKAPLNLTSSVIPELSSNEIKWEFDGGIIIGDKFEHQFNEEGQYEIKISTTDLNGKIVTRKIILQLDPPSVPDLIKNEIQNYSYSMIDFKKENLLTFFDNTDETIKSKFVEVPEGLDEKTLEAGIEIKKTDPVPIREGLVILGFNGVQIPGEAFNNREIFSEDFSFPDEGEFLFDFEITNPIMQVFNISIANSQNTIFMSKIPQEEFNGVYSIGDVSRFVSIGDMVEVKPNDVIVFKNKYGRYAVVVIDAVEKNVEIDENPYEVNIKFNTYVNISGITDSRTKFIAEVNEYRTNPIEMEMTHLGLFNDLISLKEELQSKQQEKETTVDNERLLQLDYEIKQIEDQINLNPIYKEFELLENYYEMIQMKKITILDENSETFIDDSKEIIQTFRTYGQVVNEKYYLNENYFELSSREQLLGEYKGKLKEYLDKLGLETDNEYLKGLRTEIYRYKLILDNIIRTETLIDFDKIPYRDTSDGQEENYQEFLFDYKINLTYGLNVKSPLVDEKFYEYNRQISVGLSDEDKEKLANFIQNTENELVYTYDTFFYFRYLIQ